MKLDKVVSKSMLRSIAIGIGIFWATDFIKQQAQAHGYRKFKDGQYESAIFEYKKALLFDLGRGAFDPKRVSTIYTNICASKLKIGDLKGALPECNKAIKLDPSLSTNYLNRCSANDGLKNHKQAIVDCEKAVELNPQNPKIISGLCRLKNIIGDNENALKDCNLAATINPDDLTVYHNRCFVNSDLGNLQGAIKDCTKSLRINPDLKTAYFPLCRTYVLLENAKQSLEYCYKTIENIESFDKDSGVRPLTYYLAGLANFVNQKPIEGCRNWDNAFSLGIEKIMPSTEYLALRKQLCS